MNLLTLIDNLGLTLVKGDGKAELSDVTDDSRGVTPGSLFVARDTGDERWRDYIKTAVRRGAIAVVAPQGYDLAADLNPSAAVSIALAPRIDQPLAGKLASRFFGHPASKLKLIGITGTNGKTTVATLTQYLLNSAGVKTGLLGTVAIDLGHPHGPQPAELTTPGAIDLHRHFAKMVANGCTACAMEVSSHALDQGRVDGLDFAVAVFTNLTQDHLDYHGTMENYAAAKAKLFKSLGPRGVAVLNVEGPFWRSMQCPYERIVGTTLSHPNDNPGGPTRSEAKSIKQIWMARPEDLLSDCSSISLGRIDPRGDYLPERGVENIRLPLVGRHNISNAIQALAAAAAIAAEQTDALIRSLQECPPVPGRLEPVRLEGVNAPAVLVDYAHTPDAMENVLLALRPLLPGGAKLIVVFGCGGDRDRAKRPMMAELATRLADVAVLTSDNPRTEDPQQILDDAIAGVTAEAKSMLRVEIDRATAIRSAILNALPGDTVLIAGKGHEDYQILGTEKIHFDDREHAAAALRLWAQRNPERDA